MKKQQKQLNFDDWLKHAQRKTEDDKILVSVIFEIRDYFQYFKRNLPRQILAGGEKKALDKVGYGNKRDTDSGKKHKQRSKPGHKQRSKGKVST